ncbi:extracellular solute-binding protein [Cellulomonas soli]|uniref:Sugar ABC transporter substrate-binding protein n=1 Tax=Cellulomonas soli TaxID=931535 RepID=A0A512PFK8_9CELL|nr:extracellular solute-binding protein [Cellulomonas soli]NYI59869.1 multiple sugar transport system substrate-binding protein [Cellulomonas soli]GEP69988.1 sugar ABC transporter substrate-binding protein [Cellulomonas soli]
MKRMPTTALALASLGGLTLGLTACTQPSDGSAGEGEPLTVWIMGDSGANFEKLVAPFTTESGVDVDVVAIPWDGIDERLTTAVASGDGPDLLQVGLSKLRTFADAGALMPLDDAIAERPALAAKNFADGVAGEATAIEGATVAIPWVSDTRVLFYRSDILTEAGIDTPPATWDELRADAATLAARGEGQYGYYIPQWDSALPVIMTWAQGGDILDDSGAIDFDTPEFEAAVDLYTGLYADGSVPVNGDFDQTQGFITGVTPMLISGPYLAKSITDAAPDLEGDWAVTTVPTAETGTSLFAGSSMALWKDTPQADDALDLLEFLSDPATQVDWYEINGELPTAKAALEDPTLTGDPLVAVYSAQLADAAVLPLVPNWDGGTGADLLTALNSIALQGADRDEALAALRESTAGVSVG